MTRQDALSFSVGSLLLILCWVAPQPSRAQDCFPIRGDASALTCRAVPRACSLRFLSQYTRIVFDLENKYSVGAGSFANCSFDWSSQIALEFKNIRLVDAYAFEQITVGANVRLSMRFDGGLRLATKKTSALNFVLRRDAFKNVGLREHAQLAVEITGYKRVHVQDLLVDTVLQDENTVLSLSVRNSEQLRVRNKSEHLSDEWIERELGVDASDLGESDDVRRRARPSLDMPLLKGNLSFSFEMLRLDSVHLDAQVFANLQVRLLTDI